MRTITLMSAAALALVLGACSGDDAANSAPAAAAPEAGGTSLRINTSDGVVSYETDDGKNSTSISVGESNDDNKKKSD